MKTRADYRIIYSEYHNCYFIEEGTKLLFWRLWSRLTDIDAHGNRYFKNWASQKNAENHIQNKINWYNQRYKEDHAPRKETIVG